MCYLRGACRPGDFGESGVDKDGTGAKHEKQEKMRRCMVKPFSSEEYNMVFCSVCNGKGELPGTPNEFDVCRRCGGLGLIKQAKEVSGKEAESD